MMEPTHTATEIDIYSNFSLYIVDKATGTKKLLPFGNCIFDEAQLYTKDEADVTIEIIYDLQNNNNSILFDFNTKPSNSNNNIVAFGHFTACPTRMIKLPQYSSITLEKQQVIRVGVSVLLEYNGKILLTRRPAHMRTFPLCWVLPGGHVDMGETLDQAAVRELKEEINLNNDQIQHLQIFALWESIYPSYVAEMKTVKRQHLVVYFYCKLKSFPNLKLQKEECDAGCWIDKQQVQHALEYTHSVDKFEGFIIDKEKQSNVQSMEFILKQLQGKHENEERISLGVRFILSKWLERLVS